MMTTYYKAVRHDYGSFRNPAFMYGPAETVVTHPDYDPKSDDASHYLSVSVEPADCTGFQWRTDGKDSRLLIVEPIGDVRIPHPDTYPNKRAVRSLRVVGELPISAAFGPRGEQVVAFLEKLPGLTGGQWAAARAAARAAADAVGYAAYAARAAADAVGYAAYAARVATGVAYAAAEAADAAWAAWAAAQAAAFAAQAAAFAARDAAGALVVRDKITPEQFDILTAPMRAAGVEF
jgi:hypothetical protein